MEETRDASQGLNRLYSDSLGGSSPGAPGGVGLLLHGGFTGGVYRLSLQVSSTSITLSCTFLVRCLRGMRETRDVNTDGCSMDVRKRREERRTERTHCIFSDAPPPLQHYATCSWQRLPESAAAWMQQASECLRRTGLPTRCLVTDLVMVIITNPANHGTQVSAAASILLHGLQQLDEAGVSVARAQAGNRNSDSCL